MIRRALKRLPARVSAVRTGGQLVFPHPRRAADRLAQGASPQLHESAREGQEWVQ